MYSHILTIMIVIFAVQGQFCHPPEKAKTIKIGGANPPEKGNMLKIGGVNPPETDKNLFSGGEIQLTQFSGLLVKIYLHFDPQPAAPFFFFSKLAEKQFPRIHQS